MEEYEDDSTVYDDDSDDLEGGVDLDLPFLGIMGFFDREAGGDN